VTRRRLDAELVRRGLVSTTAEAHEAVRSGAVRVRGAADPTVATMVTDDEPIALAGSEKRFVSRGGEKLAAALERFAIEPADRACLDAGASTGGFTDCLLQAGAARVIAVDVGYGQLAWQLRSDLRVSVLERTNVRDLTPEILPFLADLVVADLAFMSLRLVAATLCDLSASEAEFVLLIKPQFEARPADVGSGGVVRDPAVWKRVVVAVAEAFADESASPIGVMASPLRGPAGNVEFLLHARKGAARGPIDVDRAIAEAPPS
jgi:23S rRNA (cytidine1920-2'-O)/16S rRNA (cytidine1409-2'-O)-methyltransferase